MDRLLAPWKAIVAKAGRLRVKLECGHERGIDFELDERILLRTTMPCLACQKAITGKKECEE